MISSSSSSTLLCNCCIWASGTCRPSTICVVTLCYHIGNWRDCDIWASGTWCCCVYVYTWSWCCCGTQWSSSDNSYHLLSPLSLPRLWPSSSPSLRLRPSSSFLDTYPNSSYWQLCWRTHQKHTRLRRRAHIGNKVADNHGHCLMASLFSDVFEEDRSPTSLPQATLYLLEGECNVPKIDVRRECRVVLLLLLCYRPMVLSSCMSFIILDMQIWTDV